MSALPIIDLGGRAPGEGRPISELAHEIGRACRDQGFFYIANPPVPSALRRDVFSEAARFFAFPAEVKEKVSIARSRHNRGYVGMRAEALDPARGPDRKEAYNIGLELAPDDPELLAGVPFRGLNLWPDSSDFRTTLLGYYETLWRLGRDLHRAIAVDLGLPPEWFDATLDRPLATLRLLHYPATETVDQDAIGAGTHTDYGNITLLATDDVGGLEVQRRDGTWIAAPPIPGTLICNIGDCLMRWTNDIYVSTPHRVVNRTARERFSVAFFLDANPDALVTCLPTCQTPDRPARYPATTAADYLRSRLDATHVAPAVP